MTKNDYSAISLNDDFGDEDTDILIPKGQVKKKEEPSKWDKKTLSLLIIGILTVLYVIAELGSALYVGSLALLSDGFHNLTDAVSLYIAWWAIKAKKQGNDRAETLGGLLNGSFLVSMSLYVALEAIPRLVHPEPIEGGAIFMGVAGAGLAINTLGTIVFACTGMEHAHSHGPGGGHSHGGEKKEKKEKHGHAHGEKKEKKEKHGHSHGGDGDHGHSHGGEKKEKKEKHGHSHGNGADEKHDHDHHDHTDEHHGHSHGEKKKEKHSHGHSHDGEKKKKKKDGSKGHGHGTCMGMDLNMFGVFIHFLGDAISSLFVLITGAILHFYQGHHWTVYVDPISSLVIVGMTLASAIPLVIKCSKVLLEVPTPTSDSHDDHHDDHDDHDSHP